MCILVQIDSLDDPLQQVNFTVDSPMSMLYYPSSAVGQTSVSHRDIHWTTDTAIDGEEKSYSSEYPNPADLNTVFSNVGGGLQTFSCFYRMSPVTLLGSLQLALKGNLWKSKIYVVIYLSLPTIWIQIQLFVHRLCDCNNKYLKNWVGDMYLNSASCPPLGLNVPP